MEELPIPAAYCINNAATRGKNPSSETPPPLIRSIMLIRLAD